MRQVPFPWYGQLATLAGLIVGAAIGYGLLLNLRGSLAGLLFGVWLGFGNGYLAFGSGPMSSIDPGWVRYGLRAIGWGFFMVFTVGVFAGA